MIIHEDGRDLYPVLVFYDRDGRSYSGAFIVAAVSKHEAHGIGSELAELAAKHNSRNDGSKWKVHRVVVNNSYLGNDTINDLKAATEHAEKGYE